MSPLTHLALIWLGVFVAVVAAKKTRLTPVLFFLFIGFVFVNTGVLPEHSGPFIRELAELGIIFIMFALGFEESTSNFVASLKKSWGIALFGALAPFGIAYGIAHWIWADTALSLLFALAMTATAVSLTMVSLRSAGLQSSVVATRIMTSAVLDDIGALVLVALVVPVATGDATVSAMGLAAIAGKATVFFLLVTVIGAWVFPHSTVGWIRQVPIIGRYGARDLLGTDGNQHTTLVVLLYALLVGLAAMYFGFHPAVGAYMAGLILKEEYFFQSDSTSSENYKKTKTIIDSAAFSWIGPIFFVDLGTKLLIDTTILIEVLPYVAALTIGIIVVQVSSAALAAHFTGDLDWADSLMVGFGMMGRAELAFVVMDIAYVQHSILNEQAFYTLMLSAFFLNIAVPVSIAWWQPHCRHLSATDAVKPRSAVR